MDQLSTKFNDLVSSTIKIDNQYIIAGISLFVIMYASFASPKLPPFMLKMFNNILFKILIMFLILYVALKYPPSVSLMVSIVFAILLMVLNLLNRSNEYMASIAGNHMEGVPEYSYRGCSSGRQPIQPNTGAVGEHGELLLNDEVEEITGISDAEVESLCMHIKKDKNATDTIDTSCDFTEVIDTKEACDFAKHQYAVNEPNVVCAKGVEGNSKMFSTLAPAV